MVGYHFALDGSKTENTVTLGRSGPPTTSICEWDDNRLIITTNYPFQDPIDGSWTSMDLTQTMWLQAAVRAPWEPTLIVETNRGGLINGASSITRTQYVRGYRRGDNMHIVELGCFDPEI